MDEKKSYVSRTGKRQERRKATVLVKDRESVREKEDEGKRSGKRNANEGKGNAARSNIPPPGWCLGKSRCWMTASARLSNAARRTAQLIHKTARTTAKVRRSERPRDTGNKQEEREGEGEKKKSEGKDTEGKMWPPYGWSDSYCARAKQLSDDTPSLRLLSAKRAYWS